MFVLICLASEDAMLQRDPFARLKTVCSLEIWLFQLAYAVGMRFIWVLFEQSNYVS